MTTLQPALTYNVRLGKYHVFLVQATCPIRAISRAAELYPLASGKSFDVRATTVECVEVRP